MSPEKLRLPAEVRQLSGQWLIGLSGGADSVALTLLCLRDCPGARFIAVHVHHGLRGAEADADEAFVRELCSRLGLPLHTEHLTPPPHPGEDWARRERYAAYRRIAAQTGAAGILLAHHEGDQAETVLLHLLRGSGPDGLCAMRADAVSGGLRILRPLLEFPADALRAWLTAAGQPWREDSTNASPAYLRNRVRHELLPLCEALVPGARHRIAAAAAALQPETDLLAALTAAALAEAAPGELPLALLRDRPEAVVLRLLRERCRSVTGAAPDRERTLAMRRLIEAPVGKQVDLPGGLCARAHDRLIFRPRRERDERSLPIPASGACTLCGVTLTVSPGGLAPGDGKTVQELPAGLLTGCVLRCRRPGDFIRPFGMTGRKRLQDWLTDRRIPAADRDFIPLLCRGSEVLLAAGCGAGAIPAWDPAADNLRLCWSGDLPGLPPTPAPSATD